MIHIGAGGAVLLVVVSFLAGAVNAVAGGGSLFSFPTLLFLGVPPLTANVSSTIGLLPGYAGGSAGYRRELAGQGPRLRWLGAVSAAGGAGGALVLVHTPPGAFAALVPWLILIACGILLLQPLIARAVSSSRPPERAHRAPLLGASQAAAAVYGGYFGAGLSVITLAVLGIFLRDHMQRLNALKGVLSLLVNGAATMCFVIVAPVHWTAVAIMVPASFAGGFAGVALARRLSAGVLRTAVVLFGVAVAVRLLV